MAIIDFVRWEPGSEQVFAWKFPHSNLSTYTQLIVTESQEAILFSKGQIVAKFGPGKHTLNTENIPILRSLFGIPFGGKNPFTAEVWFVNKLIPLNIDWRTDAMMLHDPDYQTMVPLLSSGRYGLRIVDAERFLVKLVGTAADFSAAQLTDHFYGALVSKTKSTILQFIQQNRIGIKQISGYLDQISETLKNIMSAFWEDYGFILAGFYVTTIEVDGATEVGKRILEAMSRQSAQAIGGYSWQQSKAFETADNAINSMDGGQGGLLGAVIASSMLGNLSGGGLMQPHPTQGNQPPQNNPGNIQPQQSVREVYCSNCAKKFSSTMKFCPHCGDVYNPCPKCGTDNDTHASRCVSCGLVLKEAGNTCPNCKTQLPPGGMFCPNCGKPAQESLDNCQRCGAKVGSAKFCPNCGLKRG